MSGLWLISYVLLWCITIVVVALLVGTLRELGLIRNASGRNAANKDIIGYRSPEDNGPELGASIPELVLQSANGYGTIEVGKVKSTRKTLFMFMTATCEGCQLAVEALNALIRSEAIPTPEVIVVLSGQELASRSFLKLFPLEMPVILDPMREVADKFDVHATPTGLLYDGDGRLVRNGTVSSWEELVALLSDDRAVSASPVAVNS